MDFTIHFTAATTPESDEVLATQNSFSVFWRNPDHLSPFLHCFWPNIPLPTQPVNQQQTTIVPPPPFFHRKTYKFPPQKPLTSSPPNQPPKTDLNPSKQPTSFSHQTTTKNHRKRPQTSTELR
ncbi:hypothetical protein AABB24_021151 [Solanum stoloniferum]|uniref:Uncharacterized protein n=1 Tax=Solanum stoloniferum TaxID=62892 RepID=A0ABD2STS6_9SOLN